jgi:hypothetical protein
VSGRRGVAPVEAIEADNIVVPEGEHRPARAIETDSSDGEVLGEYGGGWLPVELTPTARGGLSFGAREARWEDGQWVHRDDDFFTVTELIFDSLEQAGAASVWTRVGNDVVEHLLWDGGEGYALLDQTGLTERRIAELGVIVNVEHYQTAWLQLTPEQITAREYRRVQALQREFSAGLRDISWRFMGEAGQAILENAPVVGDAYAIYKYVRDPSVENFINASVGLIPFASDRAAALLRNTPTPPRVHPDAPHAASAGFDDAAALARNADAPAPPRPGGMHARDIAPEPPRARASGAVDEAPRTPDANGGCFASGTLVHTCAGLKPIEDV